METEVKNVAYGIATFDQEKESVYADISSSSPPALDPMRTSTNDNKNITKMRSTAIVAGVAIILTILALLAAIIAIYFAIQGTELVNSSNQEQLQRNSRFQEVIQTLKDELNSSRNEIMTEIVNIKILQSQLKEKIANQDAGIAVISSTLRNLRNPVRSCSDVPPGSPSGDYWIQTNGTCNPVSVYCDMNRTSCSCNTTGGWMRVANLDMTDPNQNCPGELQNQLFNTTSGPLRICGRPGPAECVSATFQTHGVEYSHVCGRVIGYQNKSPDAFAQDGSLLRGNTTDSIYVDGVSLTHGQSPRQHIWTFVGALDEKKPVSVYNCPCTNTDIPYTGTIPSFVGQDYFCDTGSSGLLRHDVFFPEKPLWDGQGCGGSSTCCEFNSPPWFCKQLPQPSTDDIELRICGTEHTDNEDTPIEQVEIYIR